MTLKLSVKENDMRAYIFWVSLFRGSSKLSF